MIIEQEAFSRLRVNGDQRDHRGRKGSPGVRVLTMVGDDCLGEYFHSMRVDIGHINLYGDPFV